MQHKFTAKPTIEENSEANSVDFEAFSGCGSVFYPLSLFQLW
jgi:hypothetical protein